MLRIKVFPRIHISLIGMNNDGYRLNGGVGFSIASPTLDVSFESSDSIDVIDRRNNGFSRDELSRLKSHLNNLLIKEKLGTAIRCIFHDSMVQSHVGFGSNSMIYLSCVEALLIFNHCNYTDQDVIDLSGRGGTSGIGKAVVNAIESISKYKNIDERTSDIDTSKIVKVGNYISKDVNLVANGVREAKLEPVIIGNGTRVVSQYPNRKETISAGSKVFLVTNGLEYTMPNMTGWSSKEFVDFCNLIGVQYYIDGYGYVTGTSLAPGSVIDITVPINATCLTLTPAKLV